MNTHLAAAEVTASLTPFDALPDWLAAAMDGARVAAALVDHVPELADGRLLLKDCRPERLRAKEDEWLARYGLCVVGADDGQEREVVLTGTLWPPEQPAPTQPVTTASPEFGEPGWWCWLAGLRLLLSVQARDEALPALPALVAPEPAAELLRTVLPAAGYDAVVERCRPEVVRYKPGSRCTVVVHVDYRSSNGGRPPPDPVVLKTHQGDKGQTAWAAMSALWERRSRWQDVLAMAEPIAFLPEERILVQGPVPEQYTLKELARRAFTDGRDDLLDQLRDELAGTARALATMHGCGATYGRTATVEDEIAEIREVVDRLARTVPHLRRAGSALLRRLSDEASAVPADPVVAAHHDFRPAQVLLHAGRIGFIDFDGASMAEPALDLGRFRAKLRDIGISALAAGGEPLSGPSLAAHLRLQDELCDHFLTAYREESPVSWPRVRLWETCDLFTAVLHAWTKVRTARLEPRLVVLRHRLASDRADAS